PNLDELLRIQSKMKRVYRASENLSNLFDSEQLLQQLLGIVTELVPAERGCVLLLDRSRQRIEVKAITNRLEKDARSLGLSSTIIRRVFNERVGILTEDAQADPSLMSRRSVMIEGIRSVLCAPMILRQQVYGAIYLDSTTQLQAFHPEDLEAVLALGRQAAIGLENSRLVETIRQETITRANLQRFLPGHLVEQVFTQQISMRPGGTMGQVTVLFTDLRDFTRQSAGLKPDEVLLMLNAYFEEMIEVLFSHDGTLDKFIGDALMATWGATVSCADGALRAVRCALAMLERLEAFNKAHATSGWPPLKMGIGINTGPVIIGNLGSAKRMEYTVLGHTVNLASRLESLNKELNTQLLIGEETYKQVQACVQAFPHRARVKGLDQPITLYAVEGMLETPTAS
ncbi:MAG: GAF domain-containing protein, partial [Candidatus Wallbacteria bacterium]|nr:GAF domain-containing protein [Candidatus Wallbacteria bacterium]